MCPRSRESFLECENILAALSCPEVREKSCPAILLLA
jgi:hypothetical protein